jgi:uncharacterized membrane protein
MVSSISGALYGVLGYIIYLVLPITTPGVGVVRFWPQVVIPAVFAVIFGPLAGGIGAAIGIFISDVLIHGDPFLSLVAGVSSNFIGFYIFGYLYRKQLNWAKAVATIGIVVLAACLITGYFLLMYLTVNATVLFIGLTIASYIIAVVIGQKWPDWRSYGIAAITGLGIGSVIIGFTVWAYSQIFIIPAAVAAVIGPYPVYVAFILFIWTFATEIPFLIILGPPIINACFKALPSLKPTSEESK